MSESKSGMYKLLRNLSSKKQQNNPFRINERSNLDYEYYKDEIFKLKEEIKEKNKEIQYLKVSKTKKDEDYQRTMRVLQEIINKSDNATVKGMQLIDQNYRSQIKKNKNFEQNEQNNDSHIKNENGFSHPSSSYKNNKSSNTNNYMNNNDDELPQIDNILNIPKKDKSKIKEMLYINSLKQEIENKNKEINKLKKNIKNNNEEKKNNYLLKSYEQIKKEKDKYYLKIMK